MDEIVNLIKANRGAIGIVPADKARQEGLKILPEIKGGGYTAQIFEK